jgi:hypothetical protein
VKASGLPLAFLVYPENSCSGKIISFQVHLPFCLVELSVKIFCIIIPTLVIGSQKRGKTRKFVDSKINN